MSISTKTDLGRKVEAYVTRQIGGLFDRRLVRTIGVDGMAETVSHDPQEAAADPVPMVVPQGMQVLAGDDVITIRVGGEWMIGWVIRRGV